MSSLLPFIIVLIIALVVNYIPMDATLKRVVNIVIGLGVLILVLRFFGLM
jgi:hypothetical protein